MLLAQIFHATFFDVACCCSFGQVRATMLRLGMRSDVLRSFDGNMQLLGQQCWDVLRRDVVIVWPGLNRLEPKGVNPGG